jgi:histidyl-tRNA synthetase
MVQELWREKWGATMSKPARLFYVSRCYRYERPQLGRYREFTQFGIEILGPAALCRRDEAIALLRTCLTESGVEYELKDSVSRGLGYYLEDGFEVESASLGAQRQIGGGGRYKEGVGWALGIDRVLLADSRTRIDEQG